MQADDEDPEEERLPGDFRLLDGARPEHAIGLLRTVVEPIIETMEMREDWSWWEKVLSSTTKGQRLLVAAFLLVGEFELEQSVAPLVSGRAGALMPEAAEALEALGFTEQAAALRSVLRLFPREFPRLLDEREGVIDSLPKDAYAESLERAHVSFDRLLEGNEYEEGVFEVACARYITSNEKEFFRP